MKKVLKRITALVLTFTMLFSVVLTGCGKKNDEQAANETVASDNVTRAEWIQMLAEKMGWDSSTGKDAYYSDVTSSSSAYVSVQAAHEWKVLKQDGGEFKPNDPATYEFAAKTSILASQFDYSSNTGDSDDAKIIKSAISVGILGNGNESSEYLQQKLTKAVAAVMLDKVVDLYLNPVIVNKEEAVMTSKVNDYRALADCFTDVTDNGCTVNEEVGSELSVGSIFIAPGNEKYISGIAKKVVSITNNGDGTYTVVTEEPELEEVFSKIDINEKLEPVVSGIKVDEGVQLNSATSASQMNNVENNSNAKSLGYVKSNDGYIQTESSNNLSFTIAYGTEGFSASGKTDKFELEGTIKPAEDVDVDNKNYYNSIMDKYKGGQISRSEIQKLSDSFKSKAGKNPVNLLKPYAEKSGSWKVYGTIDIENISVTPKVQYNSDFWGLLSGVKTLSFSVDGDVKLSVGVNGNFSGSVGIATIPFAVGATGVVINLKLALAVDINGDLKITVPIKTNNKVEYTDGNISKVCKTTFTTSEVSLSGSLTVGPKFVVDVAVFGIDVIDAGIEADAVVEASGVVSDDYTVEAGDNKLKLVYEANFLPKATLNAQVVISVGTEKSTLAHKIGLTGKWTVWKTSNNIWEYNKENKKYVLSTWNIELVVNEEPTTEAPTETTTQVATEVPTTETTKSEADDSGAAFGERLDIDTYMVRLNVGNAKQLNVTVMPSGYSDGDLIWTSEDTGVASVSGGNVTANSVGNTLVKVSTKDGKYSAQCHVFVDEQLSVTFTPL